MLSGGKAFVAVPMAVLVVRDPMVPVVLDLGLAKAANGNLERIIQPEVVGAVTGVKVVGGDIQICHQTNKVLVVLKVATDF